MRRATAIGIDPKLHIQGLVRTLQTGHPGANVTSDPDRGETAGGDGVVAEEF